MKKLTQTILLSAFLFAVAENTSAQSALGLSFDGVDDRATIPHNISYNFGTGAFVIEAWIKADVSQPNAEPTIFSKRESNGSAGIQIYLSSGKLAARIGISQLGFASNTDLRDGQCHHIAVVRATNGYFGYYIDGIQLSAVSNVTTNVSTSHDIWIGMDEFASATSKFKGVIHEVRIWNNSFQNAFIGTNKFIYLGGYEQYLVGYWQMNNGSGQAITGSTATNPNNGYLGNTISTDASDPVYVTGCMCSTISAISSSGTVICGITGMQLSATVGSGLIYQWKSSTSQALQGASNSTYNALNAGTYFCAIQNGNCGKTSNAISLTSNNPAITLFAGLTYICSGGSVALSTSVTNGGTAPTYQWTLNGTNIAGATASSYSATQAGTYNVIVTNNLTGCSAISQYTATVTVFTGVPTSTISFNGSSSSCSQVNMTITGGYTQGLTYQWQLNNVNIAGANQYSYSATTSGNYKCIVTNPCGTSATNTLTATMLGGGNINVTGNTNFCSGTATLAAPFFTGAVFQWYNYSTPIEGANNYLYNATGAGQYMCKIITTTCGTSNTNTVTIDGAPAIYNTSVLEFCSGGSVGFNVNGGSTATAFQWKLNGTNISGATSTFYQASNSGTYSCAVSSSQCGTVTSNSLTANSGASISISLLAPFGPSGYTDVCSPPGSLDMIVVPANTGYNYDLFNVLSTTSIWNTSSNIIPTPGSGYYHVEMTTSCGTAVSNTVNIRNTTYPLSIYANGPTTFCSAFPTGLEVIPNNGWPYSPGLMGPNWNTYQWKSNGANVPGPYGTGASYVPTQTGWYTCVVTNDCGMAQYVDSTFVTVNPSPIASATPIGPLTFCSGQSVLLSTGAITGATYQWKKNNVNISGATTSSYTVATTGNYNVVVTNSCGSSTSNTIVVTVGTVSPATISGPTSFCAGSAIILSANTGTGISYQWYKSGVAQAGATSSSYSIGNAGTYYVIETISCGTATSNSIVVTQINNANPTVTYTTPTTFCSPGKITFTANTFAGVTYQWQKNSIDIAGATNPTYLANANGKYRVKETANGCTKQGTDVQVTTATSVTAVIAANGPTSFCTGGSVVLSETNNIPGYSYQWKNNNVNISGATTSSYTATSAGSYKCYVSATCGNATSNAIVVSTGGIVALVNPTGTVNICNGATTVLSANTGTGFTFQWKKNGTNISGATAANYNATTAGAYTVAITSPCGNATSVATTVAITTLTATASPASTTICNGSAATFTANTGYNFTYQWYRAGIAIAGATSSTHSNSTAGNYTVMITQGGVCSATSYIASLTVINNPNPTVTLSGPTTFCAGQSVTMTANTFAGVTYQWQKGGNDITGATAHSYTANATGKYRVKETANGCTKTGTEIQVTVNCREEENKPTENNLQLTIKPNPFTNEFEVTGLKFEVGDRIEMIDMLGKSVLIQTINTPTSNLKLQTSNTPPGVYLLKVTTSSEKKVVKVVKQ